jgi:hypothetical protein
MHDLVVSLVAWAVLLSGEARPPTLPTVTLVPHAQLEQLACGRPCPVLGLYTYGDVVLLDDTLSPETDIYARSILLHEIVHYLQERSGKYGRGMDPCTAAILRERQAYHVQNEYLARHGETPRAGSSLHTLRCVTAHAREEE